MNPQQLIKKILTDESISQEINKSLIPEIDEKYKCISNSAIIQTNQGNKLIYFAKISGSRKYCLVVINTISSNQQIIQTYQLSYQKQLKFPEQPYLQLKVNLYDPDMFAVGIIDAKAQYKNIITNIAILQINFESLKINKKIQIYPIYLSKINNLIQIKDFKWHPYQAYGILILFGQKISYFRLDLSIIQPNCQIIFKDLLDENGYPLRNIPVFNKLSIPDKFDSQNQYQLIGKKTTIYLISNTGNLFCIPSFFCNGLLLNEIQKRFLQDILNNPKNQNQKQLLRQLKYCNIKKLQSQQQTRSQQSTLYYLNYKQLPEQKDYYLYKINNQNEDRKNQKISVIPIQDFYAFNLNNHTLLVYCLINKNKQGILRMEILQLDPFQGLIKCKTNQKKLNLIAETVGQIICQQIKKNSNMQLVLPFDKNNIYLFVNKSTCYKINFEGLQKIMKKPNIQLTPQTKLIDIDILCQLKSEILCLSKNNQIIYLLRNQMNKYYFNTIALQSIPLKQKIRLTNEETEKLFQNLSLQNQKNKIKINQQQNQIIKLEQLNQTTLINLQQKLNKFSVQYKKSIQRKLQNIKILYEGIKIKSNKIQLYNQDKQQIIELVKEAQQNDTKIKNLLQKSSKQMGSSQKQINRRIKASQNFLIDLKQTIQQQYKQLIQNQQKRQAIQECEEQADGILKCLLGLKKQLIQKKRILQAGKNS